MNVSNFLWPYFYFPFCMVRVSFQCINWANGPPREVGIEFSHHFWYISPFISCWWHIHLITTARHFAKILHIDLLHEYWRNLGNLNSPPVPLQGWIYQADVSAWACIISFRFLLKESFILVWSLLHVPPGWCWSDAIGNIFPTKIFFHSPVGVRPLFLTDFNLRRGIKYTKRCLIE